MGLLCHMVIVYLSLWGTASLFTKVVAPFSYFHQQYMWASIFLYPLLYLLSTILIIVILVGVKWYRIVVLTCICLVVNDAGHLFIYLLRLPLWLAFHLEWGWDVHGWNLIYTYFLLFWWDWSLTLGLTLARQVLYCLNCASSPFWRCGFMNCLPKLNLNLPISASQVARIIGVSHLCVALSLLVWFFLRYWVLNSGSSPWATPPALFL
jgi:hypothetical protein